MKFFLLYVCKYQGRPVKAPHKMQGTIEMLLLALFSCLFLLSSLSPSCSYLPSSFHSPIFVTQLNSTCLSDSLLKQTRSRKKEEVTCISRTDFTLKTYAGGPPLKIFSLLFLHPTAPPWEGWRTLCSLQLCSDSQVKTMQQMLKVHPQKFLWHLHLLLCSTAFQRPINPSPGAHVDRAILPLRSHGTLAG